jgi:hypothetical protein
VISARCAPEQAESGRPTLAIRHTLEEVFHIIDATKVDYSHLRKFVRAAHEFAVYINSNAGGLIN